MPNPRLQPATDAVVRMVKRTTARLVDAVSTPQLLRLVLSGQLQPKPLVTHHFALNDILKAYDTFGNAGRERALKVILTNE